MTNNEIVTTSFKLNKDLYKKIKIHLLDEEINQSEFIVKAIEHYFNYLENQTTLEIDNKWSKKNIKKVKNRKFSYKVVQYLITKNH